MNAEVKTIQFQKNATSPFLMNCWYVAAISTDVKGEELFHRTILNKPVLIYRKMDGTPVAMLDRCPHRFAPLHLGKRVGDDISCLYHALQFDCEGQCTHNPHGNGLIPKAAKVPTFPLMEKYGFIWIWMGDEAADPGKLPDYGELMSGHPNSVAQTYMHVNANYQLLTDNVMDLSHIDHVHGEIISTRGQLSPLIPKIQENDSFDILGLTEFAPGKPLSLVLNHADGSSESITVNHSYNEQQIEWFKAGGALNIIRKQVAG